MIEFVNENDDIPYMKWITKFMFQTTNKVHIKVLLYEYCCISHLDDRYYWKSPTEICIQMLKYPKCNASIEGYVVCLNMEDI